MAAVLTLLAATGQGLSQDGPDDLERLLNIFYALFAGGAFIAILGHAIPSKTLLIVGIAMVFIGTGVFMAAISGYG